MASPNVNLSNCDVNRLNNGRKRKINMNDWQNIKNKNLRNSGKEYVSRSNKLVPAKTPPTVVSKIFVMIVVKFTYNVEKYFSNYL